jgi:hypothetical protein
MPGFKINGEGGGPEATVETFRTHRFTLETFLSKPGDKPPFNLLKDVDLPERVIEELQVKTPGATYRFGKQASYTDLKMTFYIPSNLINELEKMQDKIHTADTGIKDFNDYVDTIILVLNHDDGDVRFEFKNAWIGNISYGQLSYGSSEIKSATITIKYSWYEIIGAGD